MQKLKKLYPALLISAIPLSALAQTNVETILIRVLSTLNTIITLLFVIATIVFLWGVIQFIAKSGDEAARTKAKGIMTWGIIGLAVMAAAWGIVRILQNYFGVESGSGIFIGPPSFWNPGSIQ